MNAAHLPTDKLKALLGASQAIFGSFAAEQRRKNHSSSGESGDIPVLGADDFLPIFIFCTVRAELEQPMYDKALMWSLCDGDMLAGEGGYYLTVFEAALEYVKQVPLVSVLGIMRTVGIENCIQSCTQPGTLRPYVTQSWRSFGMDTEAGRMLNKLYAGTLRRPKIDYPAVRRRADAGKEDRPLFIPGEEAA